MKLPEWTKRYFNDEMRELAARSYALFTSNVLQRRLRGGWRIIFFNYNNLFVMIEIILIKFFFS